ncbi:MAG: alpha/beta hydrolase [Candidatus Gracilibacteria bacterium]|nr:alpha/beta hydrolase [Candidatus Gracilibacteria bacterium]
MVNRLEYSNLNEFCKVTEISPKDSNDKIIPTNKIFIHLGSLIHRSKFALGDLPEIVNSNGAKFVSFDWPKTEFNLEKVLGQIHDYIKQNKDSEFILCGLSFGEVISRELLNILTPDERKKVKLYISLNGVSDANNIVLPNMPEIVKKNINNKIFKILSGFAGKVDRGLLGEKRKHFLSNNFIDKRQVIIDNVGEKRINNHRKAASIGVTPGLPDRFKLLLEQENLDIEIPDVKTAILYSEDDSTFVNSKNNAEKLQEVHTNSEIISIGEAGHAALVEQPEKYNPVIDNLIKQVWKKESN